MEALVTISGHVGSDVDFRLIKEIYPRANFRLACTPRSWRNGDWVSDETTWLSVTCGRVLAEHVRVALSKGDPVVVVGRLRTSRWRDEAGVTRERISIEATTVGHDLSRGTSTFHKVTRVVDEANEITMAAAVQTICESGPCGEDAEAVA